MSKYGRLMPLAVLLFSFLVLPGSRTLGADPTVVSYEQLLDYVKLGVKEEKLLALVEQSPTLFVLGTEQRAELVAAGASTSLLAAIDAKRPLPAVEGDVTEFVIVLDCSGSMNDDLPGGGSKWDAAKKAAQELVASIPEGRKLSLVVYGSNQQAQCKSVELLFPLSKLTAGNKQTAGELLGELKAVGHTPIAAALRLAGKQLDETQGMSSLILITDGAETCHGDPVAEAKKLVESHANLEGVHVVGYCLGAEQSKQVAAIAAAGHGKYHDSRDAAELARSIKTIKEEVVEAGTPQVAEDELPLPELSTLSDVEKLLVKQLSDESVSVREQTANVIRTQKFEKLVPFLAKMLQDAECTNFVGGTDDRDAAMAAIMELRPTVAAIALKKGLAAQSFNARVWAAEAFRKFEVKDGVDVIQARINQMGDAEIDSVALNGSDEADQLIRSVRELAPDRVTEILASQLTSPSQNKKAWALKQMSAQK